MGAEVSWIKFLSFYIGTVSLGYIVILFAVFSFRNFPSLLISFYFFEYQYLSISLSTIYMKLTRLFRNHGKVKLFCYF